MAAHGIEEAILAISEAVRAIGPEYAEAAADLEAVTGYVPMPLTADAVLRMVSMAKGPCACAIPSRGVDPKAGPCRACGGWCVATRGRVSATACAGAAS